MEEELKEKIKYLNKTKGNRFLCINVFDEHLRVHKCTFDCYFDDEEEKGYHLYEDVSRGCNIYTLIPEEFDLGPYGFKSEYGDDGHYGVVYYVNIETHRNLAEKIILSNIDFHKKEIGLCDRILNLI